VYRAAIFADNVDVYLSSGTFSDDRRLSHYALLKGRVVSVDDAVVETEMPSTPAGVFRQRVRWFKGAWKYLVQLFLVRLGCITRYLKCATEVGLLDIECPTAQGERLSRYMDRNLVCSRQRRH
jgi:cellulose synthase/poly-beta-1,6-N-acetylglucosamine synthase-like glycosyltransferase